MPHPQAQPLVRIGCGQAGKHALRLGEEDARPLPVGRRFQACELDRAGEPQAGLHRGRDEFALGLGDGNARARLRVADHQVIAAPGRERARIAEDIHDDLGARLTGISMLSDLSRCAGNNAREVRSNVSQIATQAQLCTQSLDEIVWAVNPRNDNLLAHELGHAMGIHGHGNSAGTVMQPTGHRPNCPGKNPGKVSKTQCSELKSPLLKELSPKEACCENYDD